MEKDVEKVLAALSYPIPIFGIIPVLVSNTPYAKHHGWQGFFWGIFLILVEIVLGWTWFFGGMLLQLFSLAWFVIAIIFAVKAYKEEMFDIPVIADIVEKITK